MGKLTRNEIVGIVVAGVLVLVLAIVLPVELEKGRASKAAQANHQTSMDHAASVAMSMGLPDLQDADKDLVRYAVDTAHVPSPKDFPIDALYTWVKGTDPQWWAAKARAFQDHYGKPFKENPRDPLRAANDRDELYFSVHMTAKFCPWMRRIWIFSAPGHRPAWMPAHGDMYVGRVQVTVVHHDRVFDPKCVQQSTTFNSNVIEGQVPHIANLAEHFLMFNDDFFIGRPTKRTDFFSDAGTPLVHLRDVSAALSTMTSMWSQHLRNMRAQVKALHPGSIGKVPDHVVAPVRKSVLKAVVKALRSKICAMKPFRTSTDFPSWYVALNIAPSQARPASVQSSYFGTGGDFVSHMKAARVSGKWVAPSVFCINQEFIAEAAEILQQVLDQKP